MATSGLDDRWQYDRFYVSNLSSELSNGSVSVKSFDRIDLTNRVVGNYQVLHRLGSGGMSDVYLAFQESLHRHVALKVMRPDLASSPEHLKRFIQEARAAASIVHPNIVQVYDVGEFQGLQYIAQEYIAGSTLRSYIQRMGSLGIEESLSILQQVAAALSKSASLGIVHRDIKPDNILLTADGEVKVADFGLARAYSSKQELTEVGIALGTPTYMSPEQIQGHPVDIRSDLYSLGVTAYHMLSGRPPFQGDTALSLAVQHCQNKVPDLSQLRPDLPVGLIATVNRLLMKKPEDRFVTPNELYRAIRDVAEQLPKPLPTDHPLPLPHVQIDRAVVAGEQTAALHRAALKDASKSRTANKQVRWGIASLLGMVATGAGIYALIAYTPRPRILPVMTPQEVGIERQSSVEAQFALALLKDSRAYWEAIESFFPADSGPIERNYCLKAWLHLAWYELSLDDTVAAQKWLDKIHREDSSTDQDKMITLLTHVTEYWKADLEKNRQALDVQKSEVRSIYLTLTDEQKQLVDSIVPRHLRPLFDGV